MAFISKDHSDFCPGIPEDRHNPVIVELTVLRRNSGHRYIHSDKVNSGKVWVKWKIMVGKQRTGLPAGVSGQERLSGERTLSWEQWGERASYALVRKGRVRPDRQSVMQSPWDTGELWVREEQEDRCSQNTVCQGERIRTRHDQILTSHSGHGEELEF